MFCRVGGKEHLLSVVQLPSVSSRAEDFVAVSVLAVVFPVRHPLLYEGDPEAIDENDRVSVKRQRALLDDPRRSDCTMRRAAGSRSLVVSSVSS
jgi:hypothetical protein